MDDGGFVALEEIHATAIRNLPPEVAMFLESGEQDMSPAVS